MQKAIIDLNTNAIVGIANDGVAPEKHQLLLDLPEDFNPDDVAEWAYDGQGLTRDTVALLERAQGARKARIEGASFDGKQLLVWTESSDGPVWHLASRGETYAHVLKTAEAKFMAGAVDELDIAGRGWEFTTPKSE